MTYEELESLALLYRQTTYDYAWARANFPGTGADRRLARLTVSGTHALQGGSGSVRGSLRRFLTTTFPRAARRSLPSTLACLGVFLVAAVFGLGASVLDPAVLSALLPAESIEGLSQGRLWTESLTTTVPPGYSSSAIATNNMSVAITAFALGALFGVGALWVSLLNGYLLGAVIGGTLRFSMGGELLSFVAAHGPLEITLILVAAGVGLEIGRSWFVAEDRPRATVMAEAGNRGMIVILGCLPWFLVLGLVEALVSPDPTLPVAFKVLLGITLLGLFLAWVFWTAGRREALDGPSDWRE
ncbi:MAG: stage II sporulation protein M [Thermoanaerobaculia bacterium]|nr:stage II sporulation protein M [Thermoanaerobaculia bacterium]